MKGVLVAVGDVGNSRYKRVRSSLYHRGYQPQLVRVTDFDNQGGTGGRLEDLLLYSHLSNVRAEIAFGRRNQGRNWSATVVVDDYLYTFFGFRVDAVRAVVYSQQSWAVARSSIINHFNPARFPSLLEAWAIQSDSTVEKVWSKDA